jgi:hypothetical protein
VPQPAAVLAPVLAGISVLRLERLNESGNAAGSTGNHEPRSLQGGDAQSTPIEARRAENRDHLGGPVRNNFDKMGNFGLDFELR